MKVIQSFATESAGCSRIHDLIREFAEYLSARGLKGNFHLTGDFARALRRHARTDVIKALARHEIGYHCNHHGGRPFMAGYCEQKPWRDAVATWLAEELPGIRIIGELFERIPAYYTSEYQKAPQVVYGSWLAGIPVTGVLLGQGPAGQGEPLPDGGQGAAWYCNSFVPTSRFLFALDPQGIRNNFEETTRKYLAVVAAELAKTHGVLRSFTHEYPLVMDAGKPMKGSSYEDTYYEDIAFECLPEQDIRENIEKMKAYFSIIAAYPGSEFVSYTDYLEKDYYPGHGHWLKIDALDAVAKKMTATVDFVLVGKISLSPAEVMGLLVRALRNYREAKKWPERIAARGMLGPVEEYPPARPACRVGAAIMLESLAGMDRDMDDEGCIPGEINAGGKILGPGQWLQGLAQLFARLRAGGKPVGEIDCPADTMPAIVQDPFFKQKVFTRPVYPKGFTGEKICRLSRLQTWSWKPAVLRTGAKETKTC